MGNPLKAEMEPHTRQKVAIYDEYLKRYLTIISSAGYSRVNLYDPCAGKGRYGDCDGSAVVACNNIRRLEKGKPGDGCHLYLNELDAGNWRDLKQACNYPFVECVDTVDAISFINKYCGRVPAGHNLWFIDPYGYTQVGKVSISRIMSQSSTEVLLFIPLTFIYRFLKSNGGEDASVQSVANFLRDYSITTSEARGCGSATEFAGVIAKKLQEEYGYSWHATMKEKSLCYSLFFIGRHHYGLEKFLEARDKILSEPASAQYSFIPIGEEREFLSLLPQGVRVNNCEMYRLGLLGGYAPPKVRRHLASLESRGIVRVESRCSARRRKGDFYIGSHYYRDGDIKLDITVCHHQGTLL